MAMRRVGIAELKDHLSQHLRAVEAGDEVVVTDHDRPIARIVPVTTLAPSVKLIDPTGDFIAIRDRERTHVDLGISSTSLLLDERGDR